jgi:TolA-binding protein
MFRRYIRLAPLAAVCAAGCFATRNDVRIVQADVARLQGTIDRMIVAQAQAQQAALARADSLRADDARRQALALEALADSLRALSAQVGRNFATGSDEIGQIARQVATIQQLIGANARQMRDVAAGIERRSQAAAAAGAGTADSVAAATTPGPQQLYTLGLEKVRTLAYGAGRAYFEEILATYPDSPQAVDAQWGIADAYLREGLDPQADSVFQIVVTKYPKSFRAANALYKRAQLLVKRGQPRAACDLLAQLKRDHPRAAEIDFATEMQRTVCTP